VSAKDEGILARRRILKDRIAQQRLSVGRELELCAAPLAFVDQGLGVLRFIRRHPILVAGGASLLFTLFRSRSGGTWLARGLIAWRLINRFKRLGPPNVR
jgi:hypothetical protein